MYANAETLFLSTPPGRGTTRDVRCPRQREGRFLSTSPGRGTTYGWRWYNDFTEFLSTSPGRGTTMGILGLQQAGTFLSTSPGRGTTANVTKKNHCALPPFVKINTMHKYSIYILCSLYSHMPLGGIAFVIFPVRKLAPFSVRLGVAPAAGPAAPAAYGTASRRVTPTAHRPAATVARARRARPSFCTGCPAGKSAGCPPRGRSAPSARP